MTAKLAIIIFVAVLIIFISFLVKDAYGGSKKESKKSFGDSEEKLKKKIFNPNKTLLYKGPVITIFKDDDQIQDRRSEEIMKKKYTIGKDPSCDWVIDDPTVGDKHVVIEQSWDENGPYYILTNRATTNGTEYLQLKSKSPENKTQWIWLKKNEMIYLDRLEKFYIAGAYRMEIRVPSVERRVATEDLKDRDSRDAGHKSDVEVKKKAQAYGGRIPSNRIYNEEDISAL